MDDCTILTDARGFTTVVRTRPEDILAEVSRLGLLHPISLTRWIKSSGQWTCVGNLEEPPHGA